jgi:hypothetical protein
MIACRDRGFSFIRALLGLAVHELHSLCGDPVAVSIVDQILATTGDTFEVIISSCATICIVGRNLWSTHVVDLQFMIRLLKVMWWVWELVGLLLLESKHIVMCADYTLSWICIVLVDKVCNFAYCLVFSCSTWCPWSYHRRKTCVCVLVNFLFLEGTSE